MAQNKLRWKAITDYAWRMVAKPPSIRWKAVIHEHRFRVLLDSWTDVWLLFLRPFIGIDVEMRLTRKSKLNLLHKIGILFKGYARMLSKTYFKPIVCIGFPSLLRIKAKLSSAFDVAVGFTANVKSKAKSKILFPLCVGFKTLCTRLRGLWHKPIVGIGFPTLLHRYGRLIFDNRRITTVTVGMLKQLITSQLKDRNTFGWKHEWCVVPQFKVTFSANLRSKAVSAP